MNDTDKIRVLMIYYEHFGREDIRARRRRVFEIMDNLKCLQMIDEDMEIPEFSYILMNRFGYHLLSIFDYALSTVDIIDRMVNYFTDGMDFLFDPIHSWKIMYVF